MAASREHLTAEFLHGKFCTAQALDAVRDPILVIDISDARFNIIYANEASRLLAGELKSPLVGAPVSDFLEPPSIDSFARSIRLLSPSKSTQAQQLAWRLPEIDGDFATEFKLLQDPDFGSAVMLTLPSINRASRRFRDTFQSRQIAQVLPDRQHLPRVGSWEFRCDTDELVWSDGMFRVFDADPSTFTPSIREIIKAFKPQVIETIFKPTEGRDLSTQAINCDTEITTIAGRKVWVRIIGQFESQAGRALRSYGAIQDVSAEKTAQQSLSRITDWLKLSLRAASMYAWRWDRATDAFEFVLPDDVVRFLPPDFRNMDGFFSRIHADDYERMVGSVRLALREGIEVKEEFRFRLEDNLYRWYVTVGQPLLDETGEVCGLVGATQDVTNRRTTQARVREYSELLRTATANTADVLLLLDLDLNVRFCNRSVGGLDPQDMVGLSAQKVLRSGDWAAQSELLRAVLNGTAHVSFGHEAVGEDGATHRFESHAVPVFDKGLISGLSITVSDITERRRLEREILEISTREQERIGQDLHDGLGQELTGVALMLRSLATKIRRDSPLAADDMDEIVAVVNHSIESARSLARGLSPVNASGGGLVHALRALALRSRELYGLNVRFRSKVWPQLTLDEASCSHLYRIAQEALTNVARHAKAERADVKLQVAEGKFMMSITDDGVGLDRSLKSNNGMGLKLMAYRAGMIGAKLEIGTNEPSGTVVRIRGDQPPVL